MILPISDWPGDHEDPEDPDSDLTDDDAEIGEQSLSPADRNPSLR